MNSSDLWKILESRNNKEIITMICMSIKYLEKIRGFKYKELMKEIKEINKILG